MKFSCLQENLSKGIQTVFRAVPTKGALPVLSNILITTDNGRLRLSAFNLETAITTYVNASVEQEGATTVPAKLLKEFIGNLSPNTIEAHLDRDILHFKSNKTKSKFNGISAEDYPELPLVGKKAKTIELAPDVFNDAVSIVAFASGNDSGKPIFTGVLFSYSKNKLTIAATDGFRLSEKIIPIKSDLEDFTAVIPSKTILEVARILGSSEEPIKLSLHENENLAFFQADDTLVATRLLDGQYPDYKRIIPKESMVSAEFSAEEFLEAVKLTNVFAKADNSALKVRFDPQGYIKVASLSEETGTHESQFEAEVEGDLVEIAFNSKYLLDFLNNVKSERIQFQTNGNVSPCILNPHGYEKFLHIIMPMQI